MVKNEKIKFSHKKENHFPKPWPDLPQPICRMISRDSNLLMKICSKGQTKSWVTKSSKCKSSNFSSTSWLQLSDLHKEAVGNRADSFSIRMESTTKENWRREWKYWYRKEKPRSLLRCLGWSQGFLVAISNSEKYPSDKGYDIWYPSRYDPGYWRRMHLPSWSSECLGIFLSSDVEPYNNERIALVVTGITSPAFACYRLAEHFDRRRSWWNRWTGKGSDVIVDPHCSNPYDREHLMRFTNAIGFRGKFYAVSLQGTLVVIEDKEGDIGITGLCKRRVVPSVSSKHYRECLVESDGRILLVFLISRNCVEIVDDVEVYEINDGDLKLSKCKNLGDSAIFLGGNCCMAISGRRVGCKGNSIYFTHCSVKDWWVYDLKTETISPTGWDDSSHLD